MKLDTLDALRGFFAQAPFMVELGAEPAHGERAFVMKASATRAVTGAAAAPPA